jgi:23S rRNA pseudouridine2605 synthase
MAEQRLQKVLAAAGIDSRRKCEELILSGEVSVNRKVVDTLPAFVDPERDIIAVSGKKIRPARKVYFLLNKPKGVICTNSDPQGRKKAIDLVRTNERIFCVGRLDADTTGLIILTNDSELTNRLTHPRYGIAKTYIVRINGEIAGEQVEKLKKGVRLAEGKTGRASVKILKRRHNESLIEITIRQGLNRQVRRMLAKVGLPVKSLTRTSIGKLTIRGLGIGKFRTLTGSEIAYLKNAAAGYKTLAETN